VRPEERIEKATCKEAIRAGWRTFKLSFIGTRGAPDRIFGRGGRTVLIEFKAPGEEPTRQQSKRHRELVDDFGFEVYWADNLDDARLILDLVELSDV
jgi:hypothetical protein